MNKTDASGDTYHCIGMLPIEEPGEKEDQHFEVQGSSDEEDHPVDPPKTPEINIQGDSDNQQTDRDF